MVSERIPRVRDPQVIDRMMDMYACRLDSPDDAWHVLCTAYSTVAWQGLKIVKNQFDLARYFHLIARMKPEIIVETGLQNGGSVLFFLDVLAMLKMPDVSYIGVDLDARAAVDVVREHVPNRPVMLINADCLADATIREIAPFLARRRALVVLDSVHSKVHVSEELRLYAPLLTVGSHLVVEDTDHGGRPILMNYGPSAAEAVETFMAPGGLGCALGYEYDHATERLFARTADAQSFTNSPGGWLVRT